MVQPEQGRGPLPFSLLSGSSVAAPGDRRSPGSDPRAGHCKRHNAQFSPAFLLGRPGRRQGSSVMGTGRGPAPWEACQPSGLRSFQLECRASTKSGKWRQAPQARLLYSRAQSLRLYPGGGALRALEAQPSAGPKAPWLMSGGKWQPLQKAVTSCWKASEYIAVWFQRHLLSLPREYVHSDF